MRIAADCPWRSSAALVTMAEIDESVRRVLTLKEQLGLFDDPYRRGARPEHSRRASRSAGNWRARSARAPSCC